MFSKFTQKINCHADYWKNFLIVNKSIVPLRILNGTSLIPAWRPETHAAYSAETNIQRENVTQENGTQRNGRYGGEMLGRRRRRWPNISPPLHQHNVCLLRRHIMWRKNLWGGGGVEGRATILKLLESVMHHSTIWMINSRYVLNGEITQWDYRERL